MAVRLRALVQISGSLQHQVFVSVDVHVKLAEKARPHQVIWVSAGRRYLGGNCERSSACCENQCSACLLTAGHELHGHSRLAP
jgi:hypothetical protein